MKTSNKSSIITGAVLLSLSAAFTISLILQLLNFGVGGPGHDNLFFLLGNILYTVYGFSSLWIPVFLLITGLSCFATKWTAKRTVRLLTAVIPFFTSVITENICRSILKLQNDSFTTTKIIISLVIGAMLMVIEFLFAGIIADRVNDSFYKITKQPRPAQPQPSQENTKADKVKAAEKTEAFTETEAKSDKTEAAENTKKSEESPFDAALQSLQLSKQLEPEAENKTENKEEKETEEKPEAQNNENQDDDEPVTPATILTQEEFAALTQPDPISNEEYSVETPAEEPAEELEWNNLPPEQETLPPEYDEEFSDIADDDKALEFPPKDEPEAGNSDETIEFNPEDVEEITETPSESFDDDFSESFAEEKKTEAPEENEDLDIDFSTDYYDDFEDSSAKTDFSEQEAADNQFIDEANALENELLNDIDNKTQTYEEYDQENFEQETEPEFVPASEYKNTFASEENQEINEDIDDDEEDEISDDEYESVLFEKPQSEKTIKPEAPAKYVDSVVENPSYPHGIKIHNESTQKKAPVQQKQETPKPLYPTTITLGKNDENTAKQENQTAANPQKVTESQQNPEAAAQIDPDFYDIDANETAENAEKQIQAKLNSERIIKQRQRQLQNSQAEQSQNQIQKNTTSAPKSFSNFAADVFSDMENDILNNENPDTEAAENDGPTVTFQTRPASSNKYQAPVLETQLQGPAEAANDLTSDDLSAFFNAQEEENTPYYQEIQGNPPKTNRAQPARPYVIPSNLLTAYKDDQYWLIDDATKQASVNLTQTLAEFNIEAQIIGIKKGPVVTMFELLPAPGVKLSKIVALQDNIALSLAASSVRIVAPIPGKQAVGIEVPNKNRSIVSFREIIEMPLPEWDKMAVPVILGKDILGKPQLIDLVKTPHMLIAGATGSGKSVCVNSLILSILYKRSYKDVKLILVDPKVVELKLYNNIPHLLTPVITEPKKAFQALQYCLCEMERRYALLDGVGVRDIASYNQRIKERNICTEKLPYIVVIIDEFADLMATTGRELEQVVARLTAMSRAVGIHLVLATQRPSVNVITGLIKANIPSRIAFMVASRTDSNIIIDSVGAEKLLGRGDMLYTSAVDPYPVRIQGTFVSDQEVENVVNCVKQFGEPDYIDDEIFVDDDEEDGQNVDLFGNEVDEDPLYDQALEIVVQAGKASASYIQRRLKIGYNRAARLVEEMEERGIVGPANGSKPREIIHMP